MFIAVIPISFPHHIDIRWDLSQILPHRGANKPNIAFPQGGKRAGRALTGSPERAKSSTN
jgi:hypothetical protein